MKLTQFLAGGAVAAVFAVAPAFAFAANVVETIAKDPDLSTLLSAIEAAGLSDQLAEAELVTGGDSSCLMNIGGALSRQRSGVRAVHMAEILASTKEHPWTPTSAAYSKETML